MSTDTSARQSVYAVFFGNRSFFPSSLLHSARKEMAQVLNEEGFGALMLDESATPAGGIVTREDGLKYAEFLEQHKGKYQGVIICLPNFGDENGASVALRDIDVPVLIQAYPDEMDKMSPATRRDSFCGKLSIMDVFKQYGIKFTHLKPHTAHPLSKEFRENLHQFDKMCRVVGGMKKLSVGAIGARTTPFKTVRFDEIAMQKYGVTVETMDMADLFQRLDAVELESDAFKTKMKKLIGVADSKLVPSKQMENMGRLAVVLDEIAEEFGLGAMGIRCWTELQKKYGISPCLVTGEMADRGIPVSCEVDVANAVTMYALGAASNEPTSILDWNNNYGDDLNKCILFHCGNVPEKLMVRKGVVTDHAILSNDIGPGKGFGCNQGRIKPMEFTYGSMITIDGRMEFYLGKAKFTDDEIPAGFFGCAGVAEFEDLQDVLEWIGDNGHRHHLSLTPGDHVAELKEAFEKYLGYTVKVF